MKITCSQDALSKHLAIASRAIASRTTHPILANVLLVADEATQQITLTGFDSSIGIEVGFPAQVKTEGAITLPARLLNDIVSRLPEGDVTLSLKDEENWQVEIKSTSGKYKVNGLAHTGQLAAA